MNENQFGPNYEAEFDKLKKENPRPVILVAGATGAGKSSLINLVLGREVAKVGYGIPVTDWEDRPYKNASIIIYDSKGYEHGDEDQKNFFREIKEFVEIKKSSPKDAINIVWYCVSAAAARIHDADRDVLKLMKDLGIPAAAILTQVDCVSDDDIEQMSAALKEKDETLPIFLSSSDEDLARTLDPGLDALYKWSLNIWTRRSEKLSGAPAIAICLANVPQVIP